MAGNRLQFGVVGQNIRVWTSSDRSSYFDLSIQDAAGVLSALATNIKRATHSEAISQPADKRAFKLTLAPDMFEISIENDGSAALVFSFENFVNIKIPVTEQNIGKMADGLKTLSNTPIDIRRQSTN